MFLPRLIDRTYLSFVNNDEPFKMWYLESVERPYFNKVVSKYGWHLAHKAALEYFGYGYRFERFPHASLNDIDMVEIEGTFAEIEDKVNKKIGLI